MLIIDHKFMMAEETRGTRKALGEELIDVPSSTLPGMRAIEEVEAERVEPQDDIEALLNLLGF